MSDVDYGPAFRPQGVDWNNADQTVGTVNFQDRNTHAIFYMDKRHNPAKSEAAGHPVYDNIPFVRIGNPGERLNVVIRPATDVDRRRFALQWAQFQQNAEQRPDGAPISMLYPNDPAKIGLLEGCGVWTVEQLAALSGNAIENIGMGCQTMVNEAQAYLKMAEKGVRAIEFRKQLEDRDNKINQLTHQVGELNNTVTKLLRQLKSGALREADIENAGMMERPTHMPHAQFDAQSEQIAALDRQNRGAGRVKPAAPKKTTAKPRRERTRLAE
jgi:hypothetical protein